MHRLTFTNNSLVETNFIGKRTLAKLSFYCTVNLFSSYAPRWLANIYENCIPKSLLLKADILARHLPNDIYSTCKCHHALSPSLDYEKQDSHRLFKNKPHSNIPCSSNCWAANAKNNQLAFHPNGSQSALPAPLIIRIISLLFIRDVQAPPSWDTATLTQQAKML